MKKLYIFLLCAFFATISSNLYAIKAYPNLITVTQPDGTTLSIRVHGDEFFNYTTTASGQLIKAGADGYYYHAAFRGAEVVASAQRVGAGSSALFTRGGGVTIPQEARVKAQQKRQEWAQNMANTPKLEMVNTRASGGEMAALVLLVQTSDVKFQTPNAITEFRNMLNQTGYSTNGATGSVKDYYMDNSMGRYNINFVVSGIITLPQTMAYYANNQKEAEMIVEASKEAQRMGINFAQFDNDNDGVVDNVYMFFAGYDKAQGGQNTIWSHASYISDKTLFNGKRLGRYACSSELKGKSGVNTVGIGAFTHEFAHVLGTLDLYDTDYEENGKTKGLYGSLALMDGGCYNNDMKTPPYLTTIERQMLGLIEPQQITEAGNYTVESIENNKAYIIESSNKGEYFLIEHRSYQKWDKYIGGAGMLVYHIDKSNNIVSGSLTAINTWGGKNNINCYEVHPCARLVEPDGQISYFDELFYKSVATKTLTEWSSRKIPQKLNNIEYHGTKTMFEVVVENKNVLRGRVVNTENMPLQGAKIIVQKQSETNTKTFGKGLRMAPFGDMKSAGQEIITDANGKFSIDDIEKGKYSYMITCKGYANFVGDIEVLDGDNVINVSLLTNIENNTLLLSWADQSVYSALGGMDSDIYGANYWDVESLKNYSNAKIKAISFVAFNNVCNVTVGLTIDNKKVYTKEIGTNYSKGVNTINVDQELKIPADKDVMVWIKYADIKGGFVLAVDRGPAVKNYGDLFSDDGNNWYSLKDQGMDRNVILGMIVVKDDNESKVDQLVLQRNVWLDFTELNPASKEVKIELLRVGDKSAKSIDCGAVQNFMLTGLIPETAYQYTLHIDGKIVSGSFITEALTNEYVMMYETKSSYKANDKVLLDLFNLPDEVKSVKWFVNGAEYTKRFLTLTADTMIKVEIVYPDGSVETLSRKLKVSDTVKK